MNIPPSEPLAPATQRPEFEEDILRIILKYLGSQYDFKTLASFCRTSRKIGALAAAEMYRSPTPRLDNAPLFLYASLLRTLLESTTPNTTVYPYAKYVTSIDGSILITFLEELDRRRSPGGTDTLWEYVFLRNIETTMLFEQVYWWSSERNNNPWVAHSIPRIAHRIIASLLVEAPKLLILEACPSLYLFSSYSFLLSRLQELSIDFPETNTQWYDLYHIPLDLVALNLRHIDLPLRRLDLVRPPTFRFHSPHKLFDDGLGRDEPGLDLAMVALLSGLRPNTLRRFTANGASFGFERGTFRELARCAKSLTHLSLHLTYRALLALPPIFVCTNLISLTLELDDIDGGRIQGIPSEVRVELRSWLQACTQLLDLDMSSLPFEVDVSLPALRTFRVSLEAGLERAIAEALKLQPRLRNLHMASSSSFFLAPPDLKLLVKPRLDMGGLQQLTIYGRWKNFRDAHLRALLKAAPNLTHFNARENPLAPSALESLSRLQNLTYANILCSRRTRAKHVHSLISRLGAGNTGIELVLNVPHTDWNLAALNDDVSATVGGKVTLINVPP